MITAPATFNTQSIVASSSPIQDLRWMNMSENKKILRVQSAPPTKTYLQAILPLVFAEHLTSVILNPTGWIFSTIITLVLLALLLIVWYWGFFPRHADRIYVVSASGLEIEKEGKVERCILLNEIANLSKSGPAVRIQIHNGKSIFVYPGSGQEEFIDGLQTAQKIH